MTFSLNRKFSYQNINSIFIRRILLYFWLNHRFIHKPKASLIGPKTLPPYRHSHICSSPKYIADIFTMTKMEVACLGFIVSFRRVCCFFSSSFGCYSATKTKQPIFHDSSSLRRRFFPPLWKKNVDDDDEEERRNRWAREQKNAFYCNCTKQNVRLRPIAIIIYAKLISRRFLLSCCVVLCCLFRT